MVPNAAASANGQPEGGAPPRGTAPGDRLGSDGRYELVERIGSGGMGAVWRAIDHKLGCDRAVKVLDGRYAAIPAFVKRFRGEATAASRVAHPNVVAVLDVAEEDERPVFLVMELLEGKTLSQLVKSNGRLPWAQVQRYIDQIAAGLGAAHAQDVVHRDVKPGNCLVLNDGQVKILDFGIANVRDEARLTAVGEIIGTCSYMAPEQIKGHVDKRSDIYALGVVTFRLLTGRVPFSHREQDKVLLAHLSEPPPVPSTLVPDLPAGVDDFVLRMLAKQPHQRFDGMDELRRVLAGIERGMPVAPPGPTAVPPSKSHTAMFEEAPTRAVLRDSPLASSNAEPVRVSLNTAPAGSGTLAQLEAQAQAQRIPGTMLLGEEVPQQLASGGTVVVEGLPLPAPFGAGGARGQGVHDDPAATRPDGPAGVAGMELPVAAAAGAGPGIGAPAIEVVAPSMGQRAVPPRVVTVPTPTPRPLPGLAVSSAAPPRVTRFAAPGESDGDSSGMMRGVVAAFGGIALAAAVVAGWVMYTRHASTVAVPAAAPASVVGDEVEAKPVVEGEDAVPPGVVGEPGEAPPSEEASQAGGAALERGGPAIGTEPAVGGDGAAKSSVPPVEADDDAIGAAPEGRVPTGDAPAGDAKATKKRRTGKPKTGETKQPDPDPEPQPEPKPEATKKTGKPNDLRDPW